MKKQRHNNKKTRKGISWQTLVQLGDNHSSRCVYLMVQFFSFSSIGHSLCREHKPAGSKQQIMDTNENKQGANTGCVM